MPQVVQWPSHESELNRPSTDVVIAACRERFTQSGLVVLPTEAGYVVAANGSDVNAVARVAALASQGSISIGVRSEADAVERFPGLGPIGRRLARRCWPGPLVLVTTAGKGDRVPEPARRTLSANGLVALAAPHHPAIRRFIHDDSFPLVLGELTQQDGTVAATAEAAGRIAADAADLVVSAGLVRFARPATVAQVDGDSWAIRRDGVFSHAEIARVAARWIVFVCTGNTCRSPLAAVLCQRLLAERLACSPEELIDRGFLVVSAGLAALRGEPATPEAVTVARELGADLSSHASRPVTPDLLAGADLVVGMTAAHLDGVATFGGPGAEMQLLCGDRDLSDPIGGDMTVYQTCAGTIWQSVTRLVNELLSTTVAAQPVEAP
jgi:protein-tyrosine phosphatase